MSTYAELGTGWPCATQDGGKSSEYAMFLLAVGLSVVQGEFREQWASTC